MNIYINGTGFIFPSGISTEPSMDLSGNTGHRYVSEPDYTGLIPPMQLRRMSKAIRMGVVAARACLTDNGQTAPDAISAGTAMGCLQDTEQFLKQLTLQQEQAVAPTAFIQSTHNTVAGQIALLLGCNGHNLTYVHRGHSFEHALINTALYLRERPEASVLAGGIDELTGSSLKLMQRAGVYESENHPGALAGEGAAFFLVRSQAQRRGALRISAIETFRAGTEKDAVSQTAAFLNRHPEAASPELLWTGINEQQPEITDGYSGIRSALFQSHALRGFKQFSGEYPTAVAIALGLLSRASASAIWPDEVFGTAGRPVNRITLINRYLDYYSCMYLESATNP